MTAAAREQIDTDHDEEAADAESGRLTIAALRAELAATTANLRSEARLACDLRVAQDQVIERCAQAVQAEWPDAAKTLRAHVDGISGEDWGELQRELAAERAAHTDLRKQILTFSKGICAALGITDGGITGPNEPIAAIERMKAELDALSDRCRTIADEATGPHPVMSAEDALTHIEKELFELRAAGSVMPNTTLEATGVGPMSREQLVAIAHRAALSLERDPGKLRVVVAVTCVEGAWVGVGSNTTPRDTAVVLASAVLGADLVTYDGEPDR